MYAVGTGWRRDYSAGTVIVNPNKPGGSSITFSLGASYKTPSGSTVSSVTLAPVTAMILTAASTAPPPTTSTTTTTTPPHNHTDHHNHTDRHTRPPTGLDVLFLGVHALRLHRHDGGPLRSERQIHQPKDLHRRGRLRQLRLR